MPLAVEGRCLAMTSPATATAQPLGRRFSCALVASIGTSMRGRRIAIAWSPTATPAVE